MLFSLAVLVLSGLAVWGRQEKKPERAKAVVFVLTRNCDLVPMVQTMRNFEKRFNSRYRYPYLFLNDEEFTEEFKKTIRGETAALVEFGTVPEAEWSVPEWVDKKKLDESFKRKKKEGVMFGDKMSYHHMCRFNAGFFFNHPLIMKYDYYWRIEPDVQFHCDLQYDPFLYMKKNNKEYGFNIMLTEFESTIPTLWKETVSFMDKNPGHAPFKDKTLKLFMDGSKYNLCHFWSNFEIASLHLWRSEAYMAYFNHLDKAGGMFYERWGDAPIHTLAVGFMLPKARIHFFKDIAYTHSPYTNCSEDPVHQINTHCNPEHSVKMNSCLQTFLAATGVDVY
ncbi:MAG: alpha-1,2-mannosyltransferase [Amphiamblys sp. WSBS2006]|nr:MAG: alpha-1,2-mannosyltransferase [Amphiamblys sp. WSBS2006]